MNLKPNTKLQTTFSLASMTDIVFQLLIFFMLTSSFITPASLPVNLPSSIEAPVVTPDVQVTITKDLVYYINKEEVSTSQIMDKIKEALASASKPVVVLNVDKEIEVQHMVKVASMANKLGAKVSIATQVDSSQP